MNELSNMLIDPTLTAMTYILAVSWCFAGLVAAAAIIREAMRKKKAKDGETE